MAFKRVDMRKIKEILRLYHEHKLSRRKIAQSCKISTTTVTDYLSRTQALGVTWPIPDNLSDQDLEELLYPKSKSPLTEGEQPNWEQLSKDLQKKHVTRKLLWEEYLENQPDGLGYSQFCELFRRWAKSKKEVSMRIEHKAGEKLFIDYAGQTIPIHTDEGVLDAQIFLATLGASSFTFCEATWTQGKKDWLSSHVRAFKFFGGLAEILVPDNLKSGVTKACYYEPDLNESYNDLANHYGIVIIPARKQKPKDKAKVENAVRVAGMWILARLRNEKFFSLDALNARIKELLYALNTKPFQKLAGCRQSVFEEVDKPALKPLPEEHYEYADIKMARVNIDYHIEFEGHYYSVPYKYSKEQVKLRITQKTIEIFHSNKRIASHLLNKKKGVHTTLKEHMPKGHQQYSEWSPERLHNWAGKIGPAAKEVMKRIMAEKKHPEQGYRSCLGVLRLEKSYGSSRLENACVRALNFNTASYQSVKSILKSGFDSVLTPKSSSTRTVSHENIRGQKILH